LTPTEGRRSIKSRSGARHADFGMYYDDMWRKKGGTLQQNEVFRFKTQLITALVPEGVEKVIDLGCGDGSLTNVLAERFEVTGVDSSPIGISHLSHKARGIVASADNVPFADQSFDLVLSSELLEHLTNDRLRSVIREIGRLARTYILISVPNGEKLRRRLTRCASCGAIYHIYIHLQSFGLQRIGNLFPDFEISAHVVCGSLEPPSLDILSIAKHRLANRYFYVDSVALVCPYCGAELKPMRRKIFQKAVGVVLDCLEKGALRLVRATPRPDWLIVLFRRR
jgi:SAM-dependent methyltransferase